MLRQIVVEAETPGDSRTMFRLRIDANLIAEDLTTAQAHLLVGEILERIALPKLLPTLPSDDAEQPSSDSAALPLGRRWTGIDRLSQAMRAVFTALPLAGLVGVLRHILAGARSDGIMNRVFDAAKAELFETPPTTLAGARAAIAWLVEYDEPNVPKTSQYMRTLIRSPIFAREEART
jgi:hypothetical protein